MILHNIRNELFPRNVEKNGIINFKTEPGVSNFGPPLTRIRNLIVCKSSKMIGIYNIELLLTTGVQRFGAPHCLFWMFGYYYTQISKYYVWMFGVAQASIIIDL